MIAKIGRGSNLYGVLAYNQLKVEKEMGQILFKSRMIETSSGHYSAELLAQSFEPYLIANCNTEKPVLHISINPDPKDKVNDERFREMAQEYMQEMGYGQQPFVVFKHNDIDRTHIHIVSVCVDEDGKKISDKFEKRHSMNICREMERKYGLIPATEKEQQQNDKVFQPVEYQKGDVKSQIASVVRYLPKYYKFQTLGEYNALLSLFNVTTEKVEGRLRGKMQQGLLYIPLNKNGERAGHPFKASLFGKSAGVVALDLHFTKCREGLKDSGAKAPLKAAIKIAAKLAHNQKDFKKLLAQQGVNTVIRANDTGRIYGITFIDHNSRTVWNGSRLGVAFAANTFNNYWNQNVSHDIKETNLFVSAEVQYKEGEDLPDENPHNLFDFLSKETTDLNNSQIGIIDVMGGLLRESQVEDYEEQDFVGRMKKKRKRKTRR